MPGLIKIVLDNGPSLACEIRDLLALVPGEGRALAWRLFPMGEGTWIEGNLTALGNSVSELCARVDASEAGVPLSWEELTALAQHLDQTVWGTYIGCRSHSAFAQLGALYEDAGMYVDRALPAFYEAVELAFQAVDSSFWLVYAHDDATLAKIGKGFKEVHTLRSW